VAVRACLATSEADICFMLYVGTVTPLPQKVWKKDSPDIWVRPILEGEASVTSHFGTPIVQYVGATSGCGCDFPHVLLHNGELREFLNAEDDPEQLATYRRNRRALADLLRGHDEKLIEIYGVWAGNEAKAPSRVSQISLNQFLDDAFALGEQVFYRVTIEI
jgi:hypothetical protein